MRRVRQRIVLFVLHSLYFVKWEIFYTIHMWLWVTISSLWHMWWISPTCNRKTGRKLITVWMYGKGGRVRMWYEWLNVNSLILPIITLHIMVVIYISTPHVEIICSSKIYKGRIFWWRWFPVLVDMYGGRLLWVKLDWIGWRYEFYSLLTNGFASKGF